MTALPNPQPPGNADTLGPRGRKLLAEFAEVAAMTCAAKQVKRMLVIIRDFGWSKGAGGVHGPTARANVERYLAALVERGLAPPTVMNHKYTLSAWCDFLVGRGLLAVNPCQNVKVRPREIGLPRWLTTAEVREVLRIARERGCWPEVRLALSTGLRLGELIRLQWRHIDFERRCLTVHKSKTGRPRVVPLSKPALAALRTQLQRTGQFDFVFPGRRTWRGGWRYENKPRAANWWQRVLGPMRRAVPKFTEGTSPTATGRGWHLFRHTFASTLAQSGLSLYIIAGWLGHSGLKMTERYAHLQTAYDARIELASADDEGSPD